MKADPDAAAVIFRTVINVVRVLGVLAAPIIPDVAAAILAAVAPDLSLDWPDDIARASTRLEPGAPFDVPEVLFRKLTDDELVAWEARFGNHGG